MDQGSNYKNWGALISRPVQKDTNGHYILKMPWNIGAPRPSHRAPVNSSPAMDILSATLQNVAVFLGGVWIEQINGVCPTDNQVVFSGCPMSTKF